MMSPQEWKQRLAEIIERIADKRFQEKVWKQGEDSDSSVISWEEAVTQLFDDADLDGFVDKQMTEAGLNAAQQASLVELRDRLRTFIRRFGKRNGFVDPDELLSNPDWDRVIEKACQVLSDLQH